MITITLKDKSTENCAVHNMILKHDYKCEKYLTFNSVAHTKFEYEGFKRGFGVYPEHIFKRDEIETFEDFEKFWSPDCIGEVFVPHYGSGNFDCYFGRTPNGTMGRIAKYLFDFSNDIESISGSTETFLERATAPAYVIDAVKRLVK